ncbi:MAG: virulence RhuM family protein [Paludibacteraceae bacterium]|nr:virulence RhuM family protein [Paludibacteraceae bacterium]
MSQEIETYRQTEDVVVYRSEDNAVQLDVQLSEETVWLTASQMAMLFDKEDSNIRRHIINIFNEVELTRENNVRFLHVNGVKKPVPFYSLDVIISVGYRVHSVQGTRFRQWATGVLKDYLLKGYAVNPHIRYMEQRIDNKLQEHTEQIHELQNKVDFFVRTSLPPKEGIFVDGQIYDAFELIERLIKSAKKSVLLIDNYVDESVLTMMSEKENGVKVDIYTKDISKALRLAENKFNAQYGGLTLHHTTNIHDRFLILDDQTIYLIGASLKDAGKKLFAFTEISPERIADLKRLL